MFSFSQAQTQREYYPAAFSYGNGISGGGTYCQGATANALTLSWGNTFCQSAPSLTYIPITIIWYSNTTQSTTGGTVVSTINTNANTTSTSYVPSTAVPGSLFYYVVISWNNGICASGNSFATPTAYPVDCSVNTYANPTPSITFSQNPICSGNAVAITANAGGPQTGAQYTYSWTATNNAPITTYTYVTTYSVSSGALTTNNTYTLTVITPDNCAASTVSTVTVNPTPVVSLTASPGTICNGSSSVLTAGETGGVSHFWYTWGATANPPPDYNNVITTSYSVAVSPTANDTYTVTVTDKNNCAGSAVKTITVNQTPTVTVSSSPSATICSGQNTTLAASGANSYVWSPAGSLSSGTISNPVATPVTSTNYSVTGTDVNNCTASTTYSVTVNPTPTVTVGSAPSSTICNGKSTTLTASGANSYVWSPAGSLSNGTISNPVATPTTSTNYTVTGTDANSCTANATYSITVNATPTVTANATATLVCAGTTVTLSGNGATNYSWTGGVSNGVGFVPSSTQTYSVTGTNASGCTNTSSIAVNVITPPTPMICSITVDSLSNYNVLVWDKTSFPTGSVDTFFVYRDTANNNFALIGKVPFNALSQFTDTLRALYAANGDPNASTWKYKIGLKDSCGNISAKSPYHKTLFIQNSAGNFSWNQYEIEGVNTGGGVPVPALQNYLFQRDNLSNGNWATIQTLSASSTVYTDPQYSTYQNTATWRVITKWNISCVPTVIKDPLPDAKTYTTSKSNSYKTNGPTSTSEPGLESSVTIFPNPSNGKFTIQTNSYQLSPNIQIEVYNVYGEKVNSQTINKNSNSIVLNVPNGLYFLYLKSGNETAVKKLILSQ